MWRNRSLIYPAVAVTLLVGAAAFVAGYFINYVPLSDALRQGAAEAAGRQGAMAREAIDARIAHLANIKVSRPKGEAEGLGFDWTAIENAFPAWGLDFLIALDKETGAPVQALPRDYYFGERPLSANDVELARKAASEGGGRMVLAKVTGEWALTVFRPSPDGSGVLAFGSRLRGVAEELGHGLALVTGKAAATGGAWPETGPVSLDAANMAMESGEPRLDMNDADDWGLYYVPIQIMNKPFSIVIPVANADRQRVMGTSRGRFFFGAVILTLMLGGLLAVFHFAVLGPLRRLRDNAHLLVAACAENEEAFEGPPPPEGNEIATLDNALSLASAKLYSHLAALRQNPPLLERLALRDPVTELLDRKMFSELLGDALFDASKAERGVAVMLLRLEGYDHIDEAAGDEKAADLLVKEVTLRIQRALKREDLLFRLGGAEFAAYVPDCSDPEAARKLGESLVKAVAGNYAVLGYDSGVDLSVGVSLFPGDADKIQTLIVKAKIAMEMAGRGGGGACLLYGDAMRYYV